MRTILALLLALAAGCGGGSGSMYMPSPDSGRPDGNTIPDREGGPADGAADAGRNDGDPTVGDGGIPDAGHSNATDFTLGKPETLAGGRSYPSRLALHEGWVYWADTDFDGEMQGALLRAPQGGGDFETLEAPLEAPTGVDVAGSYVYWTSFTGAFIARTPRQGGSFARISDATDTQYRPVDVEVAGDHVYWTSREGVVSRAPKSGGSAQVIAEGLATGTRVAVSAGTLYFVDRGEPDEDDGRLLSWPLTGGDVEVMATGLADPAGLALDRDFVYLATFGDARVWGIPKDGGEATSFEVGLEHNHDVAVDARNLYVTVRPLMTPADGKLVVVPLDHGDPRAVASGLARPSSIVVNDTGVYWSNNGLEAVPNDGSIMWIPKE